MVSPLARKRLQAQASILSELEESLTVTSSQYEATLKVTNWLHGEAASQPAPCASAT